MGDVEEFNEYPWTGHSVIMGTVEQEGQDIDTVLRYSGRGRKAVDKYEQFVREGASQGTGGPFSLALPVLSFINKPSHFCQVSFVTLRRKCRL